MDRLNQLKNHLTPSSLSSIKSKNDDDVVIVAAYRTAITKGGKGLFKNSSSDEILFLFLNKLLEKVKLDPSLIEDVVVGNVLNPGAGATEHRAAAIAAGIPESAAFLAINRQCSSSLSALNIVANSIKAGQIKIGLACGVEAMSKNYGPKALGKLSPILNRNADAKKCTIPMGITNENVASNYNVSREAQDEFAASSYHKAEHSVTSGLFEDEILPVEVEVSEEDSDGNSKAGNGGGVVVVDTDSGPRKNVTAASLSKIRPAFKRDGTTHAGNSSQISDGASGVLLTTRAVAHELGLPIVGKYVNFKVVGVPPEVMGVGPAFAIPAVLSDAGITIDDVSVFEINEAFAAQCLYCAEKLGIDKKKLNPRGGAIALGHPLAATGGRQVATIMRELNPGEIGVTSMCLGTGMGAAAVFVKE